MAKHGSLFHVPMKHETSARCRASRSSKQSENMEAPVSIFQESPLAGEPRERLFHIHSVHHYQLCTNIFTRQRYCDIIKGCNL